MKTLSNIHSFVRFLLETPDANTRFVYLCQGLAVVVSILAVTGAFVCTKNEVARSGFAEMMVVLVGGGTALHFGRYATRKVIINDENTGRSENVLPESK